MIRRWFEKCALLYATERHPRGIFIASSLLSLCCAFAGSDDFKLLNAFGTKVLIVHDTG